MSAAWIIVIILAVIVIILAALLLSATLRARRHRRELQQRFGPEYERSVRRHDDDRKAAERELAETAQRRDRLDIRPLPEQARRQYAQRWEEVQAAFVDQPVQAVGEADRLIGAVMRERGYPVEDFDERAGLVSVDHPDVVEHYRAAHALHTADGSGPPTTEELRRAFVHYRALFAELLTDGDGNSDQAAGSHRADPGGAVRP